MLQVDPEKRITVDEAIRHPWITQPSFDPADSCGSLAARIAGLEFVRRRVYLERTLLAQAPGLANPASQNPSKVQIHQEKKAKPDKVDAETKAFINVGGKAGDETLYGESFYEVSHGGDDDGSD